MILLKNGCDCSRDFHIASLSPRVIWLRALKAGVWLLAMVALGALIVCGLIATAPAATWNVPQQIDTIDELCGDVAGVPNPPDLVHGQRVGM